MFEIRPDSVLRLDGHEDWVEGVCVSPDGKWILSVSLDDTRRVWDAETGALADTIRVNGHPREVVLRGSRVWVSCQDSTVCGYEFSP